MRRPLPPSRSCAASRRGVRHDAGFTLIELLVVLVILGLLAGLVAPRVLNYLGGARSDTARLQIENLKSALDLYSIDVGSYPTTSQGLKALTADPGGMRGWKGPYLRSNDVPDDPWRRPYLYRAPGQHGSYDLSSLGADGAEGGSGDDQDVVSW
ncbi:general secretion pathway protein G [Inquilinus ginsengisoli]|uniref:Type II secretion system core protein G n=1 Tax=Inquilinus ginsengisoli TaxID=363840 RepID=A0ABU1JQH4_9PROT|nr:type II secretion system major pseudopilin GspG [Inquilinus ginsengisoli]MDR6290874.1 general secretion pathway protein G [Inquilinus ginsengisoli]